MTDHDGKHGLDVAFGRRSAAFRRRFGIGAIVVVALLVGIGSLFAWRQYDEGKRKALNDLRARVVLASTVFDTYFSGQLSTLTAIANSPSVVRTDTPAMAAYFTRVQKANPKQFTGGIGWIDRNGVSRVSSANPARTGLSVADRSYFKAVIASRKPFISEGLRTKIGKSRVVVMVVPTFDARHRLTGVLAGALRLKPSRSDARAIDLGFGGLVVIDRADQQITRANFAVPANKGILTRLRAGEGVVSGGHGLDGSSDRVVAYANSQAAAWITVIDRPRSAVFAASRRSLVFELVSIGVVALTVLCFLGWAVVRSGRELESERDQVRHLDELTESLGDASAAAEVASALGSALVNAFPEALVLVALSSEDRAGLELSSFGLDAGGTGDTMLEPLAELAYESGDAVVAGDAGAVSALVPGLDSSLAERVLALHSLPLLTRAGRVVGSVTLLLPSERSLDENEQALVAFQAGRAGRALARTRRHEQEHDVAVALQRSLLPDVLPTLDGLELAGRYSAGGVGLEVGGDWYDAVRRADGIVHLTVGDVAGRGIRAAALMGQLRNAFRALAHEHTSPAAIAQRLLRHVPEFGMATAVFLTIDPYTGELSYASAGHPPTMLDDLGDETVTYLDGAKAPPLGWAGPASIGEARLSLPAAVTLLAYTDGVVERRGMNIDDGLVALAQLLRETRRLPAEEACDMLLDRVAASSPADDDMALLLVQVTGAPARMSIEVGADPHVVRALRHRLDTWLERRGVDESQRADVVLAISEACNNAIEHAYQWHEGTIRLSVTHDASALRIVVEDDGAWRTPQPDPTRGRGLRIMRGTMDDVRVTPGRRGTRVELELRLSSTSPSIRVVESLV